MSSRERERRSGGRVPTARDQRHVLEPVQATLYHKKSSQEAFLQSSPASAGCLEGEERLSGRGLPPLAPVERARFRGRGRRAVHAPMGGARGPATEPEEGQVRNPASGLAPVTAQAWRRRPPTGRRPTRRPSGSAESDPRNCRPPPLGLAAAWGCALPDAIDGRAGETIGAARASSSPRAASRSSADASFWVSSSLWMAVIRPQRRSMVWVTSFFSGGRPSMSARTPMRATARGAHGHPRERARLRP